MYHYHSSKTNGWRLLFPLTSPTGLSGAKPCATFCQSHQPSHRTRPRGCFPGGSSPFGGQPPFGMVLKPCKSWGKLLLPNQPQFCGFLSSGVPNGSPSNCQLNNRCLDPIWKEVHRKRFRPSRKGLLPGCSRTQCLGLGYPTQLKNVFIFT